MAASFGLHVGNTSVALAVNRNGRCDVVANDAGDRVTPAVVAYLPEEVLIGLSAKQGLFRNPNQTILKAKSLIGRSSSDPIVQELANKDQRIIVEGDQPYFAIEVDEKRKKITPAQVLTQIFRYMHDIAESHADADVDEKNTVLAVPLDFTADQRTAVAACAKEAGFHVVQVMSEPAASCLTYSLGQLDPASECYTCLVYRCGGSTLDCSVVHVNAGMFSILGTHHVRIGGDKLTECLAGFLAEEFQRKYRADPRETKRGKQKLLINAENCKHVLSTLESAHVHIESLYEGIDFSTNVIKARFNNVIAKEIKELTQPIKDVLEKCGMTEDNLEKIILCGGTAKTTALRSAIASMCPKAEILDSYSPDEAIALGAAVQSSLLTDAWDSQDNFRPTLQATTSSIVYLESNSADSMNVSTLIPTRTPIPQRRSHHLNLPADASLISVKLFVQSMDKSLTEIAELTLSDLTEGCKVSVSAHIHRDGSIHLALTDKTTGKCDQKTIQAAS